MYEVLTCVSLNLEKKAFLLLKCSVNVNVVGMKKRNYKSSLNINTMRTIISDTLVFTPALISELLKRLAIGYFILIMSNVANINNLREKEQIINK